MKLTWLGTDLLSFGINQPTETWSTNLRWALERTIGSPDDPNVLSDRITAMDFRNDSLSLAVGSARQADLVKSKYSVWKRDD